MDFGFHFGKWDGKSRENKIANPIKQEQVKKTDAYKSINSSSIMKKTDLSIPKDRFAMDLLYSA
jgi:hypothetical protein